jgi:hypothetical protein
MHHLHRTCRAQDWPEDKPAHYGKPVATRQTARQASERNKQPVFLMQRRELRHDLARKQRERMHLLLMGQRSERKQQHQVIVPDPLRLREQDAANRIGTAHARVPAALEAS